MRYNYFYEDWISSGRSRKSWRAEFKFREDQRPSEVRDKKDSKDTWESNEQVKKINRYLKTKTDWKRTKLNAIC